MTNIETKNNSRLTNALMLLARNVSAINGNKMSSAMTDGAPVIASNPELTILQTAQKMIGLRPGFTVTELMSALEQHFRPVEDDQGTDTFEYVPTVAATYASAGARISGETELDDVEKSFLVAAQALLPQVEVLLSELVEGVEDDGQAQEAREALSINLNTFTDGAMSRADAAIVGADLRLGLEELGQTLGLVKDTGRLVTALTAEHRNRTGQYLLLRGLIDSIMASGAGLNDLRNNDPRRTMEYIESALQSAVETVKDLLSSESIFGEQWSLDDVSFPVATAPNYPVTTQSTLRELLQAFRILGENDAKRLLAAGGQTGTASVQRRIQFFLNAFQRAQEALKPTSTLTAEGDLAADLVEQRVDDLIRQLQYVNTLLIKLIPSKLHVTGPVIGANPAMGLTTGTERSVETGRYQEKQNQTTTVNDPAKVKKD